MTNCSGVKDVVNAGAVCRRVCCANNKSARELFGSGKWIAVCKIAKPHVWLVCKRICLAVGSGPIEPGQFRTIFLRSEEHTSELQSLMRISSAVFCLKKKNNADNTHIHQ